MRKFEPFAFLARRPAASEVPAKLCCATGLKLFILHDVELALWLNYGDLR